MRSPDGFIPRWALEEIEEFERFPYKASWIEHSTSGIYALPSYVLRNGPKSTNNKCDGESDSSCKSFGLFL